MELIDVSGGIVVKNPPANTGDAGSVPGLGRSLEEEMTTHSSILAWEIPWTEVAYIATEFPQDKIAKGFSLYMLLSSASVIIGPSIGALIVSSYGWRSMLWVCVTICVGIFTGCVLTSRNQISVRKPLQNFGDSCRLICLTIAS